MDPRFFVTREELNNLHLDLKQLQHIQNAHTERLVRLERRQADDAAIKAAWSPFPSVLAGTPQHGPVNMAPPEDDLDEFSGHLLNSLHLAPAEEEPARRGAASRANSVRFDESALQGSNWGGQSTRHSGEFVRPGSGLMMERSLSHKSDGRHSSAGHSVHSLHSAASGRASSFGGRDDDSPVEATDPPPGLFVMGSVPSIIRCWLTPKFTHNTLLYADICTGSQRSSMEYSLVKELGYSKDVERDADGTSRIRLPVFLAEAIVSQPASRSASPSHEIHIPRITVTFDVLGADAQCGEVTEAKAIRIFIGCDALRAHSADVLLSQNHMVLYGDDRSKLVVHFVRPEDEAVFKHISTANMVPEKPKLNATAAPFVSTERKSGAASSPGLPANEQENGHDAEQEDLADQQDVVSPTSLPPPPAASKSSTASENGGDDGTGKSTNSSESGKESKDAMTGAGGPESAGGDGRRESGSAIWGSWRTAANGGDASREGGPLSGYQPATRGARNMKVLKPAKTASSTSTSARTGASYEPPPPMKKEPAAGGGGGGGGGGGDRRKSGQSLTEGGGGGSTTPNNTIRWESKRTLSMSGGEGRTPPQPLAKEAAARNPTGQNPPRSANPVGGASAFSWMKDNANSNSASAAQQPT